MTVKQVYRAHIDARRHKLRPGDYVVVHGGKRMGKILWLYTDSNRGIVQWEDDSKKPAWLGNVRKLEIEDMI